MNPELLKKYFAGKCTDDEVHVVEQWFTSKEPLTKAVQEEGSDQRQIKEDIWGGLEIHASNKIKTIHVFGYGIAACLVILLSVWLIVRADYFGLDQAELALQEYEVLVGKKSRLTLPDGTVVYINGGSVLKVPETFAEDQRVVYLSGEAFFQVQKDPQRPFSVITDLSEVMVLGTQFNVQAYPDVSKTQVAVTEGKVSLSITEADQQVLLTRGMIANYRSGEGINLAENQDLTYITDWKNGKLAFDNESLEEVAAALHRWYGIDVLLEGSNLDTLRFTGSFGKHPTLKRTLAELCMIMHLDYHQIDNKVYLSAE